MPRFRPDHNDQPVRSGGEGWLVNADQHKVVQFKSDTPTAHAEWLILRTFQWRPPDYPIPQTRRRMLSHNAIEAWETMAVQLFLIYKQKIVRQGSARHLENAHYSYKFF
nr:DUF1651 domain-containing protein [Synechococcus sp. KORDI-100]